MSGQTFKIKVSDSSHDNTYNDFWTFGTLIRQKSTWLNLGKKMV